MKFVNNLRLIDNKYLTFEYGNSFYPQVNLTPKTKIIPIPLFYYDENGYELIAFVIEDKFQHVQNFEVLIFQKQSSGLKFKMLFPEQFTLNDKYYMVKTVDILNVPDNELKKIDQNEISMINELGYRYSTIPISQNFLDSLSTSSIKSDMEILFTPIVRQNERDTQKKELDKLYFTENNISQQYRDSKQDVNIIHREIDPYPNSTSSTISTTGSIISSTLPSSTDSITSTIPDLTNLVLNSDKFVVRDISELVGEKTTILGRGAYGDVHRTNKNIAVKKFDDDEILQEGLKVSSIREISILRYLKHPNIINVFCFSFKDLSLAMPIATGTLNDYKLNTEIQRKFIFYQIFQGVQFIHSKQVWHLDIKPENILIFEEHKNAKGYVTVAKIADFGLSLYHPYVGRNSRDITTLYWRAPELLLGDVNYNESVDIWSIGVMLLEKILDQNILVSISEIDLTMRIFRLLGTPNERSWKGVTSLPYWRDNFPVRDRQFENIFEIDFMSDSNSNINSNNLSNETQTDSDSGSMQFEEEDISSMTSFETLSFSDESEKDEERSQEDNEEKVNVNNEEDKQIITNNIVYSSYTRERTLISEDEYEILFHTLTWVNKRYSAKRILQLYYWKEIANEVAERIPTKEVNHNTIQLYTNEQKQILRKSWYKPNNRKRYYNLLWKIGKRFRIEKRSVLYAMYIMDIIVELVHIRLNSIISYCLACLKISIDIFEEYSIGIEDYIETFLYVTHKYDLVFTERKIKGKSIIEAENDIITLLDFNLCRITAIDFVDQYVELPRGYYLPGRREKKDNSVSGETRIENNEYIHRMISQDEYDKTIYCLYLLTMEYQYVTEYTPAQLAQIALKVAGIKLKKLDELPDIYTDSIKEYFNTYQVIPGNEKIHELYFGKQDKNQI